MSDLYIGTKAVEAWPQAGSNGEEGYGLKYNDGYESWSPKAQFEAAYKPLREMFPIKSLEQIMKDRTQGLK